MKFLLLLLAFSTYLPISIGQVNNYSFALACKAQHEEDYKEAIRLYTLIIKNDSVPWAAYQNRASCYYIQNKIDIAQKDLHFILNTFPNDTMALYSCGLIEFDQKKWSESISFLRQSYHFSHSPNQDLLFSLGSAYYFESKMDSAIFFLEKSLLLDATNPSTLTNLAWANLAIDPKKSIRYFRLVHDIEPNSDVALNNLGYAELLAGHLETAKSIFLKAKKLNRNNPFIYVNLGLYYMKLNNKKEASKYLKKSLKLNIVDTWGEQYIAELRAYCK
jgi:tetratricopeptide (TPR) repeat protein